jgi:hypothetical protein
VLAGHYSAAFLAKSAAPTTPLWLLALAVQLLDVFWAGFVLLGIERFSLDPSLPSNPLVLEHMPYTHSLAGTLVFAGLAAFLVRPRLGAVAAFAVGGAVTSHWLLDLLVHRPDLTLFGVPPKLGLSLWNFPVLALALELGLLVGAALGCLRFGALPRSRRRPLFVFLLALVAAQLVTTLAPPALGPPGVAVTALAFFALAAWGARRVEGA